MEVTAGALKNFGADVKCADSGKAALEMLLFPHKFDACFKDIQMQEMDGYVCLHRLLIFFFFFLVLFEDNMIVPLLI
jgi:CheY-like chemotaxis protein